MLVDKIRRFVLLLGLLHALVLPAQGDVHFVVVEKSTAVPVSVANVYIVISTDTLSPIKNTFSDAAGESQISGLTFGEYVAVVEAIGYKKSSTPFTLKEGYTQQLKIELIPNVIGLQAVEVIAERSNLDIGLGKHTLHIGKDLLSDGSSALEALESLPGVETTLKGDVLVRGSSDIVIFVNGKPTRRKGSDLVSMPASLISSIELITNPSAEYDAEGVAGIVNIILRRKKEIGVHVTSNVGYRVPTNGPGYRYEAGTNGNLNYGKLNSSFGIAALISKSRNQTITHRQNLTRLTDISRYDHLGQETGTWVSLEANGSLSYEIDTSSSLDFNFGYQRWITDSEIDQRDMFATYTDDSLNIYTHNLNHALQQEAEYTSSYTKNWKGGNQKLSFLLSQSIEWDDNLTQFNVNNIDIQDSPLTLSISNDDEEDRERINLAQLQFVTPVGLLPGLANIGGQAMWVRYNTLQKLDYYLDELQTGDNAFQINQQLHALYLLHEKDEGKLRWKVGLRGESYSHNGIQQLRDSIITDKYFSLFPSAQISYKVANLSTISGTYSYRIDRPNFMQLNPYLSFQDPLNIRTGNPFLQPQFAHRYEFSYQLQLGEGKIIASLFGHLIENVIQPIAREERDRVLLTYTNIGKNNRFGSTVYQSASLSSWLQINNSLQIYHDQFNDVRQELLNFATNTSWNIRSEQIFSWKDGWKVQLKSYYYGPSRGVQQTRPHRFYVDVALRKVSSNKRLAISLQGTDIFGTRNILETTVTPDFRVSRDLVYQFQRIGINISYKMVP